MLTLLTRALSGFLVAAALTAFPPYRGEGGAAIGFAGLTRCIHFDEIGFYRAVTTAADETYETGGTLLAAVSPHFLPVMSMTAKLLNTVAAQGSPDVIILVGPNHSGEGLPYLLTSSGWDTPFGVAETDRDAIEAVLRIPRLQGRVGIDTDRMEKDHSLSTLIPFIKHYLPDTAVVPILLGAGGELADLEALAEFVYGLSRDKNVFLLVSADFSHYLNINETPARDTQTKTLLETGDIRGVFRLDDGNTDCPQALALMLFYAGLADGGVSLLDGGVVPESDFVNDIGYSYYIYGVTR